MMERQTQHIADFYSRRPYPQLAHQLDRFRDRDLYRRLLCQDLGDYHGQRIPRNLSIWVAGCGVNQALITALRFPEAEVLATDVSAKTIRICQDNSRSLGISNLRFRRESIEESNHHRRFNYIISTGVIHHSSYPDQCLRNLADALSSHGILELMVYNKYHRIGPASFQRALRILGLTNLEDSDDLLGIARRLARTMPRDGWTRAHSPSSQSVGESAWADSWINPQEVSYTVDEVQLLAEQAGLRLEAPAVSPFDRSGSWCWALDLDEDFLCQRYDRLKDWEKWALANALLLDDSPMLWFYLSPKTCRAMTESQRCEEFMSTVFRRVVARRDSWLLDPQRQQEYIPVAQSSRFPVRRPPADVAAIYEQVDGTRTMRDLFNAMEIDIDSYRLHRYRVQLTTTAFPYLMSAHA